jgi:hypothetical protein
MSFRRLCHPFGNRIGSGKNLCGLFVEHQVVVSEMRAGDVPMEIFRFDIERKHVGEQGRQSAGYISDCIGR